MGPTPTISKGLTPTIPKGPTPTVTKGPTPTTAKKRKRPPSPSAIDRETLREEQRRSQRIKSLHRSYTTFITLENLHDQLALRSYNNIFSLDNIHVPKSYEKAMQSSHSRQWKAAMDAELKGLKDSGCYIETQLPPGKRAIFSKWVLAVKTDSFGQLLKFKARCTARGDMLRDDEFEDVSSPVAGWTSIRLFLALTTLYNLTPLQLDINLAYLNAPLHEEIYMHPPPGSNTTPGTVWKLEKSLYGLKQSGKNWNELFTDVLKGSDFKFNQLGEDTCLCTRLIDDQITNERYSQNGY
jgi:hypothetical protein